jgi:RNA polymerase-binding transcription factor DksA
MAVQKSKAKNKTAEAKKKAVKTVKNSKPVLKSKKAAKLKPVKKVSVKENRKPVKTYLSEKELEYFKNLIMEEKTEILENARRLRESLVDQNTGDYVGDNSTFSMHMAEQGSDEMEREKAFMFIQRDEKYLGYLQEALDKIKAKTYGICVECIAEPKKLCKTCPYIPKERLEVVPITQHCLECKLAKSN